MAQQCLKDKVFKAQIYDMAYITLGPAVLHTVYETLDTGYQVLFHLSLLQVSVEKGTIPTLYIVQRGRHCISAADYYFSNIKPNPIVIPPHTVKNNTIPTQQQQAEDPSLLGPGET